MKIRIRIGPAAVLNHQVRQSTQPARKAKTIPYLPGKAGGSDGAGTGRYKDR